MQPHTTSKGDSGGGEDAAANKPQCPQHGVEVYSYWYYEFQLPYWLLGLVGAWLVALVVACGALHHLETAHWAALKVAFGVVYRMDDHANPPSRSLRLLPAELIARLGQEHARLFARLDRDGNGLVSLAEYEPLAHHVRQDAGHPVTVQGAEDGIYPACDRETAAGQCVTLHYRLTPPPHLPGDPSAVPYQRYDPHSNALVTVANNATGPLAAAAREVAAALAEFAASGAVDARIAVDSVAIATAFLPQRGSGVRAQDQQLQVGEPYALIGPIRDGLQFYLTKQRRIRPGVYFEPPEVAMATLLRPLHPNLFLYPRHAADKDAAVAILRAESPTHLEVDFRLHPELQLASFQAMRSVYLTPPGLEGRLVMRKTDEGGTVELLEVGLPSGEVGADGEPPFWHLESPHDIMEVGQLRLPRLSVVAEFGELPDGGIATAHNWTAEIPASEAFDLLRSRTLPHLAGRFHGNLSAAAAAAVAESSGGEKPIHVVLALGGSQHGCDANCRALRDFALTDRLVRLRIRHYYVNAWINFADAGAVAEFYQLTGLSPESAGPPLSCHLLDARTLRPLASFSPKDLRKALQPPDGLPSPLPPTPEEVATGVAPSPATAAKRRRGRLGTVPPPPGGSVAAPEPADEEELPEDPAERHRLHQEAVRAIRRQMADAYMRFLRSSKA